MNYVPCEQQEGTVRILSCPHLPSVIRHGSYPFLHNNLLMLAVYSLVKNKVSEMSENEHLDTCGPGSLHIYFWPED